MPELSHTQTTLAKKFLSEYMSNLNVMLQNNIPISEALPALTLDSEIIIENIFDSSWEVEEHKQEMVSVCATIAAMLNRDGSLHESLLEINDKINENLISESYLLLVKHGEETGQLAEALKSGSKLLMVSSSIKAPE
jgi:type II secretory pathway component PulF